MLVSMPESKVTTLHECHGYRRYSDAIRKLREYDRRAQAFRVTFARWGAYWYIHAYEVAEV